MKIKEQAKPQRLVKRVYTPIKSSDDETSPVVQSAKDECDINLIIKKYRKTGSIDVSMKRGSSGDFSQFSDLQDSMFKVVEAQNYFDQLPSNIRDKFKNNPVEFYNFASDARNVDSMRSLGLLKPEVFETKSEAPKSKLADPAPKGGQQTAPAAGEGPKT